MNRRGEFLDLRDPTQDAAYRTVRNLVAEYDEDVVRRAFAEVVAPNKLDRWSEGYRLKQVRGRPCPLRIAGRRCPGPKCAGCSVPVSEDASLWSRDGKPIVFVAQPHGISADDFSAMSAWCMALGFSCRIDAISSWRFPGGSLFVVVAPSDGSFWRLSWSVPGRKSVWRRRT